jgi:hypothetical protein
MVACCVLEPCIACWLIAAAGSLLVLHSVVISDCGLLQAGVRMPTNALLPPNFKVSHPFFVLSQSSAQSAA